MREIQVEKKIENQITVCQMHQFIVSNLLSHTEKRHAQFVNSISKSK